jgi:hypothetical protein
LFPQDLIDNVRSHGGAIMSIVLSYNDYAKKMWKIYGALPLRKIGEPIFTVPSSFAIAKDHYHLKRLIDPVFGQLVDMGIIQHLSFKYLPPQGSSVL